MGVLLDLCKVYLFCSYGDIVVVFMWVNCFCVLVLVFCVWCDVGWYIVDDLVVYQWNLNVIDLVECWMVLVYVNVQLLIVCSMLGIEFMKMN